jgi:hypothetical protein
MYLRDHDQELASIDNTKLENYLEYCPELKKWVDNLVRDNKSINVVYASQYLNNPASMFGHTFLHFENEKAFIWVAVDYAAQMPASVGGISYAFNGGFSATL